jgi:hypothetical protein
MAPTSGGGTGTPVGSSAAPAGLTLDKILAAVAEEIPGADLADFIAKANECRRRIEEAGGGRWSWLEETYQIPLVSNYTTGTVTVTEDSATVTGDGTAWTAAMVGRQFRVEGVSGTYTIAARASGTSLTLDRAWARDTAAAQSYSIYQQIYALPSDFRSNIGLVNLGTGKYMAEYPLHQAFKVRNTGGGVDERRTYCYMISGTDIVLLDGPAVTSDTLELCYYKAGTDAEAISEAPSVPVYLHDLVKEGVLYDFMLRHWGHQQDRQARIAEQKQKYFGMLDRAMSADRSRTNPFRRMQRVLF